MLLHLEIHDGYKKTLNRCIAHQTTLPCACFCLLLTGDGRRRHPDRYPSITTRLPSRRLSSTAIVARLDWTSAPSSIGGLPAITPATKAASSAAWPLSWPVRAVSFRVLPSAVTLIVRKLSMVTTVPPAKSSKRSLLKAASPSAV